MRSERLRPAMPAQCALAGESERHARHAAHTPAIFSHEATLLWALRYNTNDTAVARFFFCRTKNPADRAATPR